MLDKIKTEWHKFIGDQPGERFENHAKRAQQQAPKRRAAQTAIGGASIVAGTVMLVVPGPGGLAIAFGVALIAGNSRRLARRLDDTERALRKRLKPAKQPAHENR